MIAHNIGLTHFISTRVACKGWRCNGFMTISCATGLSHNPPKPYHYREKRFVQPRFNDYRIDWCLEREKDVDPVQPILFVAGWDLCKQKIS